MFGHQCSISSLVRKDSVDGLGALFVSSALFVEANTFSATFASHVVHVKAWPIGENNEVLIDRTSGTCYSFP